MHDFGWLVPVLIVTAVMARGAFTTWVKAKHGYPLEDRRGRRARRHAMQDHLATTFVPGEQLDPNRKIELLTNENEKLTGQVSRLEERIAVLERIATDPAERTAREIDALRDR